MPDCSTNLSAVAKAYNRKDRNGFLFRFNPQVEIWDSYLAMTGFLGFLLWDFTGYSAICNNLHLIA